MKTAKDQIIEALGDYKGDDFQVTEDLMNFIEELPIENTEEIGNEKEEAKRQYISNPSRCPYCKGEAIGTGSPEFRDNNLIAASVSCHNCKKEWHDLFTLTNTIERTP